MHRAVTTVLAALAPFALTSLAAGSSAVAQGQPLAATPQAPAAARIPSLDLSVTELPGQLGAAQALIKAGRFTDAAAMATTLLPGLRQTMVTGRPAAARSAFEDYGLAFLVMADALRLQGQIHNGAEAYGHAAVFLEGGSALAQTAAKAARKREQQLVQAAEKAENINAPYVQIPSIVPWVDETRLAIALVEIGRDAMSARITRGLTKIAYNIPRLDYQDMDRQAAGAVQAALTIRAIDRRAASANDLAPTGDLKRFFALARLDGFDPNLIDVLAGHDITRPLPPSPDAPARGTVEAMAGGLAKPGKDLLGRVVAAVEARRWDEAATLLPQARKAIDAKAPATALILWLDLATETAAARGKGEEAAAAAQEATAHAADKLPPSHPAALRALYARGYLAETRGQFQVAYDFYQTVADRLTANGQIPPVQQLAVLRRMAALAVRSARLIQYAPHAERVVKLARDVGDQASLPGLLGMAAAAHSLSGNHDAARKAAQELVGLTAGAASPIRQAMALTVLGGVEGSAGRRAEALARLREAGALLAASNEAEPVMRSEVLRSMALAGLAAGEPTAFSLAARSLEAIGVAPDPAVSRQAALTRSRALSVLAMIRAAGPREIVDLASAEAIQGEVNRRFRIEDWTTTDLASVSLNAVLLLASSRQWQPGKPLLDNVLGYQMMTAVEHDHGNIRREYGDSGQMRLELAAIFGEAQRRAGRPIEAVDTLQGALDLVKTARPEAHQLRARLATSLGRAFLDIDEKDAAMDFAREAVTSAIAARRVAASGSVEDALPGSDDADAFHALIRAAFAGAEGGAQ